MMWWSVVVAIVATVEMASLNLAQSNIPSNMDLSMSYPMSTRTMSSSRLDSGAGTSHHHSPQPYPSLSRPTRSVQTRDGNHKNYPGPDDQLCDPEHPPIDYLDLRGSSSGNDDDEFTADWLRKRPLSRTRVLDTAMPGRTFHSQEESLDLVSCLNNYRPECGTCAIYRKLKYSTLIDGTRIILEKNFPKIAKLLEIPPKRSQFVLNTQVRKVKIGPEILGKQEARQAHVLQRTSPERRRREKRKAASRARQSRRSKMASQAELLY